MRNRAGGSTGGATGRVGVVTVDFGAVAGGRADVLAPADGRGDADVVLGARVFVGRSVARLPDDAVGVDVFAGGTAASVAELGVGRPVLVEAAPEGTLPPPDEPSPVPVAALPSPPAG